MSSRRTYRDAIGWVRGSRAPVADRGRLPWRIFGACFAVALVVWGVSAYVSPESFGQPGADILSLGWPTLVLVGLVVSSAAALLLARARIKWIARRVKELTSEPCRRTRPMKER